MRVMPSQQQQAQQAAAAASRSSKSAAAYKQPPAPHPSLPVSDTLTAYYTSLLAQHSSLSTIAIRSHLTKGRFLHSLTAHSPSTLLFTEPAALAASDDPAVCVSCHGRHEGTKGACDGYSRWKGMKAVVNAMGAAAEEFGYGESRGLMVADWVVNMQQVREREREEKGKNEAVSLAASFALPAPTAPSFSFAPSGENSKATTESDPDSTTSTSFSSPAPSSESSVATTSERSQSSLALASVLSLDAGSSSFLASHRAFASALWHCLPLPLRRLYSVNELNQLVCTLEVNAHELVDEQGEKGEGLFPFFAMIEHSCYENCAFTALSSSSSSTGPSVSVHCLRPIAASSSLSISYCPPYLPTSQRRAYLQNAYHFHCSCALCSGERPDKCRAFVCDCGGCVWVSAEGATVTEWKCTECARDSTSSDVSVWREVEQWMDSEVVAVVARMEEEADSADQTAATKRKRAAKRREDVAKLTAIAEAVMRSEKLHSGQQDELLLSSATPQPLVSHSLSSVTEEKEADEQDEDEAIEEKEEPVSGSTHGAADDGVETSLEALSLSKSQLRNKKRREKQKQQKLATAVTSASALPHPHLARIHPSHHHCHTLLDLLCSHYASVGDFRRAAQYAAQRVRNVRRVLCGEGEAEGGGGVHWMEAVEWSVLAELYGECREWERRKLAFVRCWRVNQLCFGDEAASTMYARRQMMSAAPTDKH